MRVQGLRRALFVAAFAVAALAPQVVGAQPPPSSPQVAASPHVELASYSIKPKIDWYWWGAVVRFNPTATRLIASGAGGAVGSIVGGEIGWAIGTGVAMQAASDAVDHGNCLEYVQPVTVVSWWWRYHC